MRSFDYLLHEHLPLTDDTESVVSFIRTLQAHDGGANLMVPIDDAERVFATSPKDERSRRKVLIIVSDGKSTDSDSVAKRCAEMRAKGTLIVMLGVGTNMSRKALRTFASPGCDFLLDQFNALTNEMMQLVHKIQDEHEQMLRVEFSFDTIVDLGCNIEITSLISNEGNQPVPNPRIVIRESAYFRRCTVTYPGILQAGETVTVRLKLRAKNGAQDELQSMHWLSKSCELSFHTYALKNPQNPHDCKEWTLVSCQTDTLHLNARMVMTRMLHLKPLYPFQNLNTLMVGPCGSGKSTLISCFFRWALEQEKLCVCESGERSGTVTNEIQHLLLSRFCGKRVWLNFIDTWGIEDHDKLKIPFTNMLLKKLLRGVVPPGFRPMGDLAQSLEVCTQMSIENLPHCVIFVVDSVTNGDPATTQRLAELTKIVDELHRDYIILVTHCSNIDPTLSGSDLFDSQCQKMNDAKDQTAGHTLDRNRIIFMENIGFEGDSPEKRIFCRDLALFRVLLRLFEGHQSKMREYMKNDGKWKVLMRQQALKDDFTDISSQVSQPSVHHTPTEAETERIAPVCVIFKRGESKERIDIYAKMSKKDVEERVRNVFQIKTPGVHMWFRDAAGTSLSDGEDFFDESHDHSNPVFVCLSDDVTE